MKEINFVQKIFLVCFGCLLFFLITEIFLRTTATVSNFKRNYLIEKRTRESGDFVIICVGESTTEWGGKNSYPHQLEELLAQRYPDKECIVVNAGRAAATTIQLMNELPSLIEKFSPHAVITMMGINDSAYAHDAIVNKKSWKRLLYDLKLYRLMQIIHANVSNFIYEQRKNEINIPASAGDAGKEKEHGLPNGRDIEKTATIYDLLISARRAMRNKDFQEAEIILKEAMLIDPLNEKVLFSLALSFHRQWKYEAIDIFEKVVAINPENYTAYGYLARILSHFGEFEKARNMYQYIVENDPDDFYAYFGLAKHHVLLDADYATAASFYERSLELNPLYQYTYFALIDCYKRLGKEHLIEALLKKGIHYIPDEERLYGALGQYYFQNGESVKAQELFDVVKNRRIDFLNSSTIDSYNRLKKIAQQNPTTLFICMQYPRRSAAVLKQYLGDDHDIVVLSNRKNFSRALEDLEYDDLFIDQFAGDFGHCSAKGNRLIAENIIQELERRLLN